MPFLRLRLQKEARNEEAIKGVIEGGWRLPEVPDQVAPLMVTEIRSVAAMRIYC
jgi:hypothetical protein